MSEWKETTIGELITLQRGHDLVQTEFEEGSYLVAGSNGPIGYHKQFTTKGPGLTIGRSGNSIGVAHFYQNDFWAHNTVLYSKFFHNSCPKFVYFLLKSIDFKLFDGGSAVPTLNRNHINLIPIVVPIDINEQTAIAEVLSSLDDKIDLLHRQNKTLEQLAETLFRQWFVEEAEEGWEIKKIKDVCITISKGTTPTTLGKQFKEVGINFIKAESLTNIGGFLPEKFAFIDKETDELLKRSRIQKGDILITIAGTIGRIAYVTDEILPANTNQAIGFMRANQQLITPHFIYCLFKTAEVRNDFEGRVVHAVQPNLSLGEIGSIEFKMPPREILITKMKELEILFDKKEINTNQIRTLSILRDTLLPKLMSGEVRVI